MSTHRLCYPLMTVFFMVFSFLALTPALSQVTGVTEESDNGEAHEFSSEEDFLAALAAEGGRLHLQDVHVSRGASDEVVGVIFQKKSDVEQALRSLGGGADTFTIGDNIVEIKTFLKVLHSLHRISTTENDSATADAESASIAALSSGLPKNITVCDPNGGNFCTYNSTSNDHYTIFGFGYHKVSSGTMLKKGGRYSYDAFY